MANVETSLLKLAPQKHIFHFYTKTFCEKGNRMWMPFISRRIKYFINVKVCVMCSVHAVYSAMHQCLPIRRKEHRTNNNIARHSTLVCQCILDRIFRTKAFIRKKLQQRNALQLHMNMRRNTHYGYRLFYAS